MKGNTMKMKTKIFALAASLLTAGHLFAVTASSGEVKPGEWNTNWQACKDFAVSHGTPIMAVWGMVGCHFCAIFDGILEKQYFIDWAQEKGLIMAYVKGSGWSSEVPWITGKGTKRQIGGAPGVHIYWEKDGKVLADEILMGRISKIGGSTGEALVEKIMSILGNWEGFNGASYSGGSFAFEETEGNRLEAEDGTTAVSFELTREGSAAEVATNNLVILVGPDGQEKETVNVEWAEGQTNQTVTVDISKVSFTEDGQQASIIVQDADGTPQGTNHVTYVAGNSSSNPLWIGERKASKTRDETPVLEYGEWTMDLDVAKAKVEEAEGDAYTLVAIVGSLWCHDCANTARNFTDVADKDGNNRFAEWAKSNNVALVSIDIPNFSTNSVECASPTLLSRKAYETQLAYELPDYDMYDVSKGGAPESLAKRVLRSGLGYLTRKGVSDDRAAEVLERNWRLVSANTDEGGFHRPEDTNKFRTGVPIFVLLRKDGTVAARLTRFASKSPMADANWDNIIKRFDEMLEIAKDTGDHADPTEIENNDASTTTLSFRANGGSAYGEISHTDFQDVFKLEGVGGNALQKVTVTGVSDAVVSVQFMKLNEEGKSEAVGKAVTGKLSEGIALEETFAEAGDFFVKVSGGDIASGSFTVDNAAANNFAAFEISGDVVLVPQEAKASGSAPEDSDRVVMRLEKDQMYRIEGVDPTNEVVAAVLEAKSPDDPYCKFYTALVSGDEEVVSAYGKGGTVTYQKWVPCKVGFVAAAKTVTESVGKVSVAIARTDGSSGDVTVRVSLDKEATTLYNSEGEPRFVAFEPLELTWADGKVSTTNVTIEILDDKRFDDAGEVALKLEFVSDWNGDTVLTTTNYVLTVTEDDKQSAGQAAFAGADPFFSKKATVYAKEDEGATVYAERIEASDGCVSAKINATGGAKLEIGGVETNVIVWANHKYESQAIKVTGLAAGKSATLTLASPTDGLKILSASNKVTVVSVAADAPAFETDAASAVLHRYVTSSNVYPVVLAAGVEGAKLTFTKLSGTLPAGLKVAHDAAANALAVFGATTAKEGVYTVVYQVVQQVGTTKTPGLTIELTYEVSDPTVVSASGAPYNEAVAKGANGKGSSRTFKDLALLDVAGKRLAGILQVTVPQKGNASAKLKCADGDIAFSTKSWSGFSEGDGTLSAELTSKKAGYAMTLAAENDGGIIATVTIPGSATPARAESDGIFWSKTKPATTWAGYYTVALRNNGSIDEEAEGVAPRGHGYLTLTMNTAAAINAGTVKWAGMLPDGKAISGSAILNGDDECTATLPIFAKSSADVFAALLDVCATGGTVTATDGIDPVWLHSDKYEAASFGVLLGAYGGLYNATNANLAAICEVDYGTTEPVLSMDVAGLSGQIFAGTPSAVTPVKTTVTTTLSSKGATQNKIAIKSGEANPQKLTLKFTPATGVVSGKFNLPYKAAQGADKTLSANYAGVIIIGYGPGCGCGREVPSVTLPLMNGAFYINDKMTVNNGSKDVQINIKRGGAAVIDQAN